MNMWKRLSPVKKEIFQLLIMSGFGLVKQFLVYNLPIMAVPKGIHDDWIMVHLADTLRSGQWLGEYNSLTLTKGMFFPLYLAVINFFHLSYLNVTAFLYTVSCMVFVYALRPLVKKPLPRLARNSISYIQVLFIFAGFLAVYLRRREPVKKHISWMIAAAAGTVSFFYTREDAIWIVPFLVVFVLVYLGSLFGMWRRERKTEMPVSAAGTAGKKTLGTARPYMLKVLLVLVPFLSLWGAGKWIARQNLNHYGIEVTNELQSGGFAEMYKSMMAVKPEEDIPGVTMTNEKIARMCEVCPTLKELEPYIRSSKEYWAGEEGDAENWEVRDGWVFWIFRTALEEAGYYTDGAAANAVCLQIRDEIEAALDAGLLERQATMPSTYMSPWRKGYLGDLFGAMGKAIAYTTTYDEMETLVYLYSEPDENGGIPLFERITGDKAVWYESDLVEMAGWYVSYEGMEGVTLQAELSDGTVLGTAEFTESEDVASYLAQQGIDASGSEKCRFSLKLSVEDKPQTVYLRAYRNGELLDEYELSEDVAQVERENSRLNLDWYWDVPERHGFLASINYKGGILNGILQVYRWTGPVLAALGFASWLLLSVRRIRCLVKKEKDEDSLARWLVVTSLLASYLVLLGGISYSEISGWNAILYWYLSGGYPVMIAFEVLALIFAWYDLKAFRAERKGK